MHMYAHVCGMWPVHRILQFENTQGMYGQTCSRQKRKVLKMDRYSDTWKHVRQPSPYIWSLVLHERKQTCVAVGERLWRVLWENSWISFLLLQS